MEVTSLDLEEIRTSSFWIMLRASRSIGPRAPIPLGPMSAILTMTKENVMAIVPVELTIFAFIMGD